MIEPGRITLVAAPGSIIAALHGLTVTTLNPLDLPEEPQRAAQAIVTTGCDVVVLGPELPVERSLGTALELTTGFPEIEVLLVAPPSESVLAEAMRTGVRRLLPPELDQADLRETVLQVATAAALRRTRLAGPAHAEAAAENGRVIVTMAAKGGAGKTTVAVNLAAELARSAANDVVLVDLDLMAGEIDLLLGIEPKATIASVACEGAVVDAAVVKLSLSTHPSGLLVLCAPETLIDADGVDSARVVEVLNVLKQSFSYVVVDTAPGAGAALAAAVEVADDLFAIATPDAGGLRSLRRNLDGLEALGLNNARTHLVVNRSDHRTGITSQAIENAVEMPITQTIPDAQEIAAAANQGAAYVRTNPKSDAARAFKALAARIAPAASEGRDRHRQVGP